MSSFLAELKRRNVFKVAVAYAIVAWVVMQVVDTFFSALNLPAWTNTLIAVLLLIGFPIALLFAWAFELTAEGIKPSTAVKSTDSIAQSTGQKLNYAIITVLLLAVGYMFAENYLFDDVTSVVANNEVEVEIATSSAAAPAIAVSAPITAIAVLPFDNLSPNPENSYFASGMHEEILNSLAKLSALDVKSRTSVLRYAENRPSIKDIAVELEVGTVLEGSVRFANNRVRVTTQLIDAASGNHLWSETYEHEFEDIFAIESDVAMNIANALDAEFSIEEQQKIYTPKTDSPAALALAWKAIDVARGGSRNGLEEALLLFDQAIELDLEFAEAYALRAWLRGYLINPRAIRSAPDPDAFIVETEAAITEDVERALSLNSDLGFAYIAIAIVHERHLRGSEALIAFQRANELLYDIAGTSWSYSEFSRRAGRFDDAVRLAEEAWRAEPEMADNLTTLGLAHLYAGNLDAAESAFRSLITVNPAGRGYLLLARVEALRGNSTEALVQLQINEELSPGRQIPPNQAELALWFSIAGDQDKALNIFKGFENNFPNVTEGKSLPMGVAYLAIGDFDAALLNLRGFADENSGILGGELAFLLKFNVMNLPVLEQPEFVEVRNKLGFTDL